MKFFLDTADVSEIRALAQTGLIDGVTTNPSLIAKSGRRMAEVIAEICAIEDLGFCKKGEAGKFTADGETALNGKIPVNTSGGLKACGHPVGATGIKQVFEVVQQLRGEAGKRQIDGATTGMTHNVGGTGATVAVHILGRA